MRKEAQNQHYVTLAHVDGYHAGGSYGEGYAFAGFESNKYFTSDRYKPCHVDSISGAMVRDDGQPMEGFGLEIETECNGINNDVTLAEVYRKIIFPYFPEDLFKMQRDSTLNGRSNAEVISQVMTKACIRNNYRNFKLMFNTYFPAFGIRAAGAGCGCGMHVNISTGFFGKSEQARETAIRKLYYIINKHYDFCKALFYRTNSTAWCGRMDYSIAKTMNIHNMPGSHGNCFNGSHYDVGRVEIRLVGGQKDYACFRNTMESVFYLCEQVRRLSWRDCDYLPTIFAGCNQYVFDRIKSYCKDAGTIPETQVDVIGAKVKREDLI